MVNQTDYATAAFALYRYAPSKPAAVAFDLMFVATTIFHLVQLSRTKTWYMLAFVTGGLFEALGYAARAVSASQEAGQWTITPYVVQNVLLLVAPALFAASIYMILGRIILLTDGESRSIIRRTLLTKLFVFGDVFSFMIQSGAGSMMAAFSSNSNILNLAQKAIIGGLFLQIAFFGFFIIVAAIFHTRMLRSPTARSLQPEIRWTSYLGSLYFVSCLILIRSVFRAIEYLQGNDGMILRHEYFMYIFDATLMFGVMLWMNFKHPGEIGILLRERDPAGFPLTAQGSKISDV